MGIASVCVLVSLAATLAAVCSALDPGGMASCAAMVFGFFSAIIIFFSPCLMLDFRERDVLPSRQFATTLARILVTCLTLVLLSATSAFVETFH